MEPEQSLHKYTAAEKLDDVALALADYAHLKSPFQVGRSRRVADLAERVARRIGLPEQEAMDVHRAALVHDIGIVAVPSFVLDKPQHQLTAVEREQVRLHPYHSERILSRVPALASIVPMVSAHHERMDGRGYHRGLTRERAPRSARILAVTDQFDELTHDAPDHLAMDPERALDLMHQDVRPVSMASKGVTLVSLQSERVQ